MQDFIKESLLREKEELEFRHKRVREAELPEEKKNRVLREQMSQLEKKFESIVHQNKEYNQVGQPGDSQKQYTSVFGSGQPQILAAIAQNVEKEASAAQLYEAQPSKIKLGLSEEEKLNYKSKKTLLQKKKELQRIKCQRDLDLSESRSCLIVRRPKRDCKLEPQFNRNLDRAAIPANISKKKP